MERQLRRFTQSLDQCPARTGPWASAVSLTNEYSWSAVLSSLQAPVTLKGSRMRIRGLICIAVGLMLTVAAAWAEEVTVVSDVLGPEGPLFVDGNLYYVAWTSGTLSKWDGKTTTVLNSLPGCSHNGLAFTKQKTFLLACCDEHGAILELDMKGNQLRRWDADDKGSKFEGGINDIVVTAGGGAYATVFGPYQSVPTAVAGRIL